MKLTKAIFGVPDGEVYPRTFEAGEDCPDSLIEAARAAGALPATKAIKKAPENK